ncbi:MAG: hypothetical protein AAF654_02050 [Myxococcota bacterium]
MASIAFGIDERLADLPDRERAIQERETTLLETYAKLEEQRSLLADDIVNVETLLDTETGDDSEIGDQLESLKTVGADLEDTYRPLVELREEILLQRIERCEQVASRVKDVSDELLESRETLERLRAKIEAHNAEEPKAPKLLPVEEPPVQHPSAPEPVPSPLEAKVAEAANEEVIDLETHIDLTSEDNFYCGLDDSEIGVFASTIELLPLGQRVHVRVQVNGGDTVAGFGSVKWFRDWDDDQPNLYPGMGIELVDLDDATRRTIEGFMEQREPWLFV